MQRWISIILRAAKGVTNEFIDASVPLKEDSDDEDDGDYVPRTRGDGAQAVG